MQTERLDKIISNRTPLSRSEARAAIKRGRVSVGGAVVKDPAYKADCGSDSVALDGQNISGSAMVYLMLNKPSGYVTSTEERGQRTVLELIGADYRHYDLFPAGRLDKDTEGFLLLTNDGDFCHRVISPSTDTVKLYELTAAEPMSEMDAAALLRGVTLGDGTRCRPAKLTISSDPCRATIAITEGRYHEIKRMLASLGNAVTYLKRLAIGGVPLDERLAPGEYRELTAGERALIFQQGDISSN